MKINFPSYKSAVVDLKGGINESVSSLELKGGELIDVKNYMIKEGDYGGYSSVKGYERFDGNITPSEVLYYILTITNATYEITEGDLITGDISLATATALSDAQVVSGSYVGGDARVTIECSTGSSTFEKNEDVSSVSGLIGTLTRIQVLQGGTVDYHKALDLAYTQVIEVPGEGSILGLHIFKGMTYVFRKKTSIDEVGMYVEDSTGWLEIDTSGDPIVYSAGNHKFRFANYNFYAGTGTQSMYWVDSVNKAREYNTIVTTISNTGMGVLDKPRFIATHNFYLFLGYTGASLQHSALGDPTDWTAPGEIGVGDEITNLISGVKSSLIIYMTSATSVLNGIVASDFSLETFSLRTGAKEDTAQRMFGTVYAIDDTGLTSLAATDAFGDFAANSISEKFKKTLLSKGHEVISTTVSRGENQYRVFFDDKQAIFVTFAGAELKGASLIEFNNAVDIIAEGEDPTGRPQIIFASDEGQGWVYKMDSGTSFDGIDIVCRMSTSYYHYGSPRQYKGFKRGTFEVRGEQDQSFAVKVNYDYLEPDTQASLWNTALIYAGNIASSEWGSAIWGTFIWGQLSTATNRIFVYLQGIATNASYRILSKEKYRQQHTIQNIITDYDSLGRRV